jgi:hypothetical protein
VKRRGLQSFGDMHGNDGVNNGHKDVYKVEKHLKIFGEDGTFVWRK